MIAKIKTGAKFYGAARYNQQKVDSGQAKVLYQSGFLNTDPQTIADTLHYVSGSRVKKPVFHASLSFTKADGDKLDDGKMDKKKIAGKEIVTDIQKALKNDKPESIEFLNKALQKSDSPARVQLAGKGLVYYKTDDKGKRKSKPYKASSSTYGGN